MNTGGPLFHGGKPGLQPGDELRPEPHFVDGCQACAAKKAGVGHVMEPLNRRPERVYATTDREYARFYASKYPRGDLYTVDLVELEAAGDEDPFPSFTGSTAIVVGVVERYVQLTHGHRRRLLHRWAEQDRRRGIFLTPGELARRGRA